VLVLKEQEILQFTSSYGEKRSLGVWRMVNTSVYDLFQIKSR